MISPVYADIPFVSLEKDRSKGESVIIAAADLQNRPSKTSPAPAVGVHPFLWSRKESGSKGAVETLSLALSDSMAELRSVDKYVL
jgi:hypothetical protein